MWFIRRQLSIDEPLLQLRVLKSAPFAYSAVIVTVINSALSVGSVILPIYLQNVLGLTAFETGVLMTPGAVCTIFLSPISGILFDKFGPRVIAIVGLTGLFGSMVALAFVAARPRPSGTSCAPTSCNPAVSRSRTCPSPRGGSTP